MYIDEDVNFPPSGESMGGPLAEAGEDGQHLNAQLLPVPAAHGRVLRGHWTHQRHYQPAPRFGLECMRLHHDGGKGDKAEKAFFAKQTDHIPVIQERVLCENYSLY